MIHKVGPNIGMYRLVRKIDANHSHLFPLTMVSIVHASVMLLLCGAKGPWCIESSEMMRSKMKGKETC